MDKNLGNLRKINIREKWSHEALEFTPWLAKEENIMKLGQTLGLELEVENTEVAVGPYWADILAKDTGNGNYVIIENQLEKTDHDHLGKAITYASVLDASAVIWVASKFTEEHKKALDWLNEHTSSSTSFYGVVLELWQIDDSRPAVFFNVISQPNEVMRQAMLSKSSENLSDARKLQFEFWTRFKEILEQQPEIPSVQSARPQYWYDISLGRSGITLSNIASTTTKKIGVRIYISNKIAHSVLPQLVEMKDEIESEIGQKLEWNPNPENKDKIICLTKDADLELKGKWPEYLNWLTDLSIKFRKAFAKRVKHMDFNYIANQEGDS